MYCVFVDLDSKLYKIHGTYIKIAIFIYLIQRFM